VRCLDVDVEVSGDLAIRTVGLSQFPTLGNGLELARSRAAGFDVARLWRAR
jgi:hypothetical protein